MLAVSVTLSQSCAELDIVWNRKITIVGLTCGILGIV